LGAWGGAREAHWICSRYIWFGEIDIVDFDIVSLSNIHRQIAFKLEDRDRYSVMLVAERVREKSPFVSISGHQSSFSQFISKSNGYRADLIIDASDNMDVTI